MPRKPNVSRTGTIIAAILGAASILSSSEAVEQALHDQQLATCTGAFAQVKTSDGIDANEARLLASSYFQTFMSGCGGVMEITATGTVWTAKTLVGLGAQPGPDITIDRASGCLRSTGGPTVALIAAATSATVEITR